MVPCDTSSIHIPCAMSAIGLDLFFLVVASQASGSISQATKKQHFVFELVKNTVNLNAYRLNCKPSLP